MHCSELYIMNLLDCSSWSRCRLIDCCTPTSLQSCFTAPTKFWFVETNCTWLTVSWKSSWSTWKGCGETVRGDGSLTWRIVGRSFSADLCDSDLCGPIRFVEKQVAYHIFLPSNRILKNKPINQPTTTNYSSNLRNQISLKFWIVKYVEYTCF